MVLLCEACKDDGRHNLEIRYEEEHTLLSCIKRQDKENIVLYTCVFLTLYIFAYGIAITNEDI